MAKSAINISNITHKYDAVKALDDLSLTIPSGGIFGFLGPNGAGKTTTISILLGLLEPTSGYAEVMGYNTITQSDQVRTKTGVLLEHAGNYEELSAEDNLEFFARINNMPVGERRARIKELLIRIGLWKRRKEIVRKWSRGMKQKLAIARAVLHRPSLILLDEPTAGLDVLAAAAVRDHLASLAINEGTTIFLTTHNMVEAERLCTQVAVIRQGKLLAVGNPDDLRTQTGGLQVEVVGKGFSNRTLNLVRKQPQVAAAKLVNKHMVITLREEDEDCFPLVNMMVRAGVHVSEVHKGITSLEKTFVTLMEEGNDERYPHNDLERKQIPIS
jgi:ABC-2 type transport system ATP-binding protein